MSSSPSWAGLHSSVVWGGTRSGQHLLGQRRSIVGQVRLGAEQGDGAAVIALAEALRDGEPSGRRADDDDPRCNHRAPFRSLRFSTYVT
jgi:hypothetical protein